MHDVFVLVDKGTHTSRTRSLILVLDDIEGFGAICIDGSRQHKLVELSLGHWVNLTVHIKLNFKAVNLRAGTDARH